LTRSAAVCGSRVKANFGGQSGIFFGRRRVLSLHSLRLSNRALISIGILGFAGALSRLQARRPHRSASPRSERAITKLALISSHKPGPLLLPTQWSHDFRNLLATVGLHLDTLARLSGSHGAKTAGAAHSLVVKLSGMCAEVAEDRSR